MGWDSSGDLPPQQPRNFRDRYRNDFEDGMGAAYAADQSDNNDAGNMNFGEHAAGFDVDTRYDQRPPANVPLDQWGQPTQGYPTPPTAPQGWQFVGPNQPYPDPYQQQQNYYPQPPPLGQAPDPYQQQNYYPQPPGFAPAPYPAQPTPNTNLLGGQAGVVTQDLPSSVLDFQNRLNNLGSLPSPYQQADKADESADGIDRFFGSSLSGLPCLGNIGTALVIVGVGVLLICLMAFLALGSLDRHLGLGIFYQ